MCCCLYVFTAYGRLRRLNGTLGVKHVDKLIVHDDMAVEVVEYFEKMESAIEAEKLRRNIEIKFIVDTANGKLKVLIVHNILWNYLISQYSLI